MNGYLRTMNGSWEKLWPQVVTEKEDQSENSIFWGRQLPGEGCHDLEISGIEEPSKSSNSYLDEKGFLEVKDNY